MDGLVNLIVGHRGTGKTSFLREIEAYAKNTQIQVTCWDLDAELERETGTTINEIFKRGETAFRALETKVLAQLMLKTKGPTWIALGAGFEGPIPDGAYVLWLRRVSDAKGRVFLNRPRLNLELSPFEEYFERFNIRQERFAEMAHAELLLPEGYVEGLAPLVLGRATALPFALTLLSENFRDWSAFLTKRKSWGVTSWEIRDDLLSEDQRDLALDTLPLETILYSQRKSDHAPEAVRTDWALELGEPPGGSYSISLHEREEDFTSTLTKLAVLSWKSEILKLAVEVGDFTELQQGHLWWKQDPTRRSFLPRSQDGRWRWYRSLFGPQMPLHFVREGDGSALDQPPLWQALLQPAFAKSFAAVLGAPVEHSRTPMEHAGFFKDRGMPVVNIHVPEQEFTVALAFLIELGLSHAAVTAPLKKLAWASATRLTTHARQMQAANTLLIRGREIFAHNTDVLALQEIQAQLPKYKSVWLWGGGGIKTSVKTAWPLAVEVSAREPSPPQGAPELLIWATGRSRKFAWPQVRPHFVLDLNYGDDSPGLEWAVKENLPYQSGLQMFKLQADRQRSFWQQESL